MRWRLPAVLFLAAFAVQGARGIATESLTWDEGMAIGSSYVAFRHGDLRIIRERPPLLGALLVPAWWLAGEPRLPEIPDPESVVADQRFGDELLHAMGNETVRLVQASRWAMLLASLGLGVVLAWWAFQLGRAPVALLALALFATCPNLLAHARIAANDMPCAIFVFAACAALAAYARRATPWRAVVAGIALGLALTSKLTGLMVLPIVGLAWILILQRDPRRHTLAMALYGLATVVTVGAAMGGTFDYRAYIDGLRRIYTSAHPGYLYYLEGRFSAQGWWYYHLYAVAVKTPLPLLLLGAVGVGVLWRRERDWVTRLLILGPVVAMLGASAFDRANIGLRRVLPIYPFLILVAAQAVRSHVPRRVGWAALLALACWQVTSLARAEGHHLSYFNELVGGPANGRFYLDDSNVDWGQDLPSVRTWLDTHPGLPVRLAYFGMARPETYGIEVPRMDVDAEACAPAPAVYVVSAHLLVYFEKIARERGPACSWMRRYRPIDRIAFSMWVFDLRPPP